MDESLVTAELEARIGVPSESVAVEVSPQLIRRLHEMLGHPPAVREPRVPPAVLVMPDAGREVSPLPGLPESGLVTGDEWELRREIRLGETLLAVNRLADVAERLGSRLGHTLTLRHDWTFTDAAGDVVAVARRSMAYYMQDGLRPRRPTDDTGPPPPLTESPGAAPRTAREGDALPARMHTPTLEQVIRYCAVTWNITPIFFDPGAARMAGLPGTIIPGPLKLALLADNLLDWAGPDAVLESIRVAHRRPDVPGRPLLFGGTVSAIESENTLRRLRCEVWIQNEAGERSAAGAAAITMRAGE